jgi:hypothetical protein
LDWPELAVVASLAVFSGTPDYGLALGEFCIKTVDRSIQLATL